MIVLISVIQISRVMELQTHMDNVHANQGVLALILFHSILITLGIHAQRGLLCAYKSFVYFP